jgi:molybdopterin molybdotransferase
MSSQFFNVQPVHMVLEALFAQWKPAPRRERLDTSAALGRVLAIETRSPIELPSFRRSAMDGYAVRAADTFGASQSLPAYFTVIGAAAMGEEATIALTSGGAVEVHTGGMLPEGADAVVMIERTQPISANEIEVFTPVAPGENVVQVGEDVGSGQPILPAGHRVRPQDIGGLLAVGITSVEVVAEPRVGILSCGDELVPPQEIPQPGQIRDINAYTLAAFTTQRGGKPVLLGIARDTLEEYQAQAQTGFEQVDMLVLTAGSSLSTRDFTRTVINGLGEPGVLQHGLAVKPGKPTIIGLCAGRPVIGLPGNPVSALLVARQILGPIIQRALGERPQPPTSIRATLTANIASVTGREDTVPVRLMERDGVWAAEPVFGKSNLIYTLVNAVGLVHIPLDSNGLKAGADVEVVLFDA